MNANYAIYSQWKKGGSMKMGKISYACMAMMGMGLIGAETAFADVTAVYKMTYRDGGSGLQTIKYADKKHVRLDMMDVSNHETTMMKLGDKVYMIHGEVVQDMEELAGMMAMMGKGSKKHADHAPLKYVDTGRTETIAGITGKVYSFEERGKRHEVVLAKNKDLQAAVLGLVELTKAMSSVSSDKNAMGQAQEDASLKSMAMLRLDDHIRLQSMNKKGISKSVFELPAKPQQTGGMGALMKGFLGH
jgi:hypothetical protein